MYYSNSSKLRLFIEATNPSLMVESYLYSKYILLINITQYLFCSYLYNYTVHCNKGTVKYSATL